MQLDQGERRRQSSSQRLPVNPRRHKVAPEQRKRVATACNSCNVRRVKCSGGNPCGQCATSNRDCVYPVPIEKIQVPRAELDELKKKIEVYEKALQDAIPDPSRRQEIVVRASAATDGPTSTPSPFATNQSFNSDGSRHQESPSVKQEPDDETTSGRLLQDATGTARFLGETSGATFLDQLKGLLGAVLPLAQLEPTMPQSRAGGGGALFSDMGRYYTDDSLPIVDAETKLINLPTEDRLSSMLSDLRYLIQDGNGEYASGGIYWWGDLNSVPPQIASPSPDASESEVLQHRYLAFYYAALAVLTQANSSPATDGSPVIHELYFGRAAAILGNPLEISRCCTLSDVRTLSIVAYYLIEMNRRDAAYMHIAAAMHICIMLGVHRGLVDERGKRVFWTVYTMDRWLSCLMGRPHIIMDDAIRLELPADSPGMPPAAGLKAHVELSRISGYVVHNTYRVAPWEPVRGNGVKQPDKAIWMMQQWQSTLPSQLQLSPDGLSNDPACCLLHMRYNMLLILAIRPLFLAAVKKSIAKRLMVHSNDEPASPPSGYLKECIAAARRNIRLGRHMTTLDIRRTSALHAEIHFISNATVCLILEDLVSSEEVSPDEAAARERDISFGLEMEEESMTSHARSSSDTLCHLWTIVRKLTSPQDTNISMTDAPALQQPIVQGMVTAMPDYSMPYMPIGEDHALYDELLAWVDDDWSKNTTGWFTDFGQVDQWQPPM